MNRSSSPIFEEIGRKVVESLKPEDHFTDYQIQQIASLFESGDIADQDKVMKVLEGGSSEDISPRD